MSIPSEQREQTQLVRDKYDGDTSVDLTEDLARLASGEPLAYVIGWVPFLGLRIHLDSRPLIPRPETEWWTEELITHLKERFGESPFTLLDLCAGSGAIGLAVLSAFPAARVSFAELIPEHLALIWKNIGENGLDATRATLYQGDLFEALHPEERFAVIATNPPYVPSERALEESVTAYEPSEALYAGSDGLAVVRRIAVETKEHLLPEGELWMECDIDNIEEAKELVRAGGCERAELRTDPYGRPRIVVGYYA